MERFEDLSAEEIADMADAIKKIDEMIRGKIGNRDYLLLQKNGREAGQSVPHVHFHYLPGSKFLVLRFLIRPWLRPMDLEEIKLLKKRFSEQT